MRDHLELADLCSPEFRVPVQLDLVHDRLKSVDLHSLGFLFLVQLDLLRRSTEASFDSTYVEFQACCAMFQYDMFLHYRRLPCAVCRRTKGLKNLLEYYGYTLR